MPATALAFDMFGTLADPASYADALRPHTAHADELARSWRTHQLETSWLLSLAGAYEDWSHVTRYALHAALAGAALDLAEADQETAIARAATPDLYDEVPDALAALRASGFDLSVFSNGNPAGLDGILRRHGIESYFDRIVSCDEVRTYKPAPVTYRHAAERIGAAIDDVWLVSGNPFDCAGGKLAGMRVAKVERQPSWTYSFAAPPDVVVGRLADLPDVLAAR